MTYFGNEYLASPSQRYAANFEIRKSSRSVYIRSLHMYTTGLRDIDPTVSGSQGELPNNTSQPSSQRLKMQERDRSPPPSTSATTTHISPSHPLRNISVLPIILPLHIILLNQPIDVLLDVRHGQHAPAHSRFDDLADELRVPDGLPALHDAHNCRLGLEVAVLGHAHVRLLVLLFGLFQLHLVDFHAVLRVREVWVEGEGVGG